MRLYTFSNASSSTQCTFFFLDFLPIFVMPVNLTSDLYFALAPKINTTLMFNWAGIYRIICLAGDFARFLSRIIIFPLEYLGIWKVSFTIIGKLLALLPAKHLDVWISKLEQLFAKISFQKDKILGLLVYVKWYNN